MQENYGIKIDQSIEPLLNFETNWIQERDNHKAIFDYFYGDVIPDQSLCSCVCYAGSFRRGSSPGNYRNGPC